MADAPPATLAIPARTNTGTNWTGAFLLYAKGASLQEISEQLKVPFKKLMVRARDEDWENMVRLNGVLALRAPATSQAVAIMGTESDIKANRAAALKIAYGLRDNIQKTLDAFSAGNIFLPTQDIARLAQAARTIDESAMMALGDDPAPKLPPPTKETKPGNDAPHTHFHFNMPPAILSPRRVQGDLAAAGVEGRQVDAVLEPGRVELVPEEMPDPVVASHGKRSAVDFSAMAKQKAPEKPAAAGTGIPDFARDVT